MKILPPEHMKAYLEAAERRGLLPMFYLELVSGLRKGELVALRQYIRNPNRSLELTRSKTENSVRLVSIPQAAVELLIQEHDKHPDNPYLFPSPLAGEMYHPDSVVNLHKKILKDAGLGHLRFHDLRHTYASLMIADGTPLVVVSRQLGHAQTSTTANIYAHAIASAQARAMQTFDQFNDVVAGQAAVDPTASESKKKAAGE